MVLFAVAARPAGAAPPDAWPRVWEVPPLNYLPSAPVLAPPPGPGPRETADGVPDLLRRPIEGNPPEAGPLAAPQSPPFEIYPGAPPGFTGPSGVAPSEVQQDGHFVPVEDRWRAGFPVWDRYGKGHPPLNDYPYAEGHWWNPYTQHVLKGDYPIVGQHTFLEVTGSTDALFEFRQLPAANNPADRTATRDFFGRPDQFFYLQPFSLTLDLFHGNTVVKPVDWRIRITPVFAADFQGFEDQGVGNPPAHKGVSRGRSFTTLQEWFAEAKLADLSPSYDFLSVRAGSQPFISDFRGFIYSDTNRGVRLFGTAEANRDQFNLVYFNQLDKEVISRLNELQGRKQQVVIGNFYRQDFIWPGYTIEGSVHYNHDEGTFKIDQNGALVRPEPVGAVQLHTLDVVYLGFAGEGHINRINVSHAFYWALGHDSLNPFANRPQDISAQMGSFELSYDRDWTRLRASVLYFSGDANPNNKHATGFDTILDNNPNFAGGPFSFWQHQGIPLFGVNLKSRFSLVPDLRTNNLQGQSNFVNPGLLLVNTGVDFDVTPKLRMTNNFNLLWFDETAVLEQYLRRDNIRRFIGGDLNTGFEYRPFLNNQAIVTLGVATLIPGQGFKDLYNRGVGDVPSLVMAFMVLSLAF
jgi:hypothetical protein